MTYEFEYLLHLFSCGARGITPNPPRQPVDYDRMIQLAEEQSVLPLVGVALSRALDLGFPFERVQSLVKKTRMMALSNFLKRRITFNLLKEFEKTNIQAVLLKGYPIADLYAEPDCRISCDTDIYVNIEDEIRTCRLLKENGCKVERRTSQSHHAICEHPKIGRIELHVLLYNKFVEGVWFGAVVGKSFIQEEFITHTTKEGTCYTLGKTDNLIYLTLHMIKHFVRKGASLRQMMDLALYIRNNAIGIDVSRFWKVIDSLKYQSYLNTVFSIMVKYCDFSIDDFPNMIWQSHEFISAILDDLEAGGWLGSNESNERQSAENIYNRKRHIDVKGKMSYIKYVMQQIAGISFRILIPSRSELIARYPNVSRSVFLIPLAWVYKLITGFSHLVKGKVDIRITAKEKGLSYTANERIELFRKMQMM